MAKFKLRDKVYFLVSGFRMEDCPICKGTTRVKAKMFGKDVEIQCPAYEKHKEFFRVEIERYYVHDSYGYITEKREMIHTFYDPNTTKFIRKEKRYATYTIQMEIGRASDVKESDVFKTLEEAKKAAQLRNNEVDEAFKKQYIKPVY